MNMYSHALQVSFPFSPLKTNTVLLFCKVCNQAVAGISPAAISGSVLRLVQSRPQPFLWQGAFKIFSDRSCILCPQSGMGLTLVHGLGGLLAFFLKTVELAAQAFSHLWLFQGDLETASAGSHSVPSASSFFSSSELLFSCGLIFQLLLHVQS